VHKKIIVTATLVIVIAASAVAVMFFRKAPSSQTGTVINQNNSSSQSKNASRINNPGGACADGPLFTVLPIELSRFTAFRPLGFVTIPTHMFGAKHSNFVINQPGQTRSGVKVVFPSDAIVTQITSTKSAKGTGYQLVFYPCEQFKSYFFHLGTLSEPLQHALNTGSPQCQDFHFGQGDDVTKCELKTEVKVKTGDVVGTNDGSGGVDWGGVDYRVSAEYANPDRYDFDYPHYVSPVAYLTPDLKTKMLDKLRSYDGSVLRTAEPRWGTIANDIKGTAQGNWFLGDKSFVNTQDFSIFLALIHDYIDSTEPIIVMGTSVKNLKNGVYSFEPQTNGTTNRDFKDIKPDGQLYCFDQFKKGHTVGKIPLSEATGVIIMSMPDEKKLKVEYHPGTCSEHHELTANATTFDR